MANQIVKLKKGSDYLFPQASFFGVDTTNLIASKGRTNTAFTYTATEDCFVFFVSRYLGKGSGTIMINGVELYMDDQYISYEENGQWLALKKDDVLYVYGADGGYATTYKVFGIKR